MDKWKQYSQEKALINSFVNNFSDFNITNAKLDELHKWEIHKVYDAIDNCNEKFTDLRWVFSEKYINSIWMEKLLKDRKILRRGDAFTLGIFLAWVWQIYTVVSSCYRLHTSCLHHAGVTSCFSLNMWFYS